MQANMKHRNFNIMKNRSFFPNNNPHNYYVVTTPYNNNHTTTTITAKEKEQATAATQGEKKQLQILMIMTQSFLVMTSLKVITNAMHHNAFIVIST